MADEIKDTQTPSEKKVKKSVKRLPIIIAAVVVVAIVGVAGWAWHATPECCDTICHSTMGKYYDSFTKDTNSLAFKHNASSNNQCIACHEADLGFIMNDIRAQLTGDYSTPMEKVTFSNDFCLQSGCHLGGGMMPGASTSNTADWSFDPHSTYHGGVVQQCNSCHRMHDQSVFTCGECHTFGTEWNPTPEGWNEVTREDGQITAVPEGWTIPTQFVATTTN